MSPVWYHKITGLHPLKIAYQDGTLTFEESRDRQVAILRAAPCYSAADAESDPWSFSGIVDEDLATADDENEFDRALSMLYDVCDHDRIWLDPIR